MTGYQEILTDPSYRGQIVTMTYPEIGNYGVNAEDVESRKPHLAGFVVRELSRRASNFRSERRSRRVSRRARRRRHRGDRHPGAGPADPHPRGHEGRPLDGRPGRRQPGGQGQGQPGLVGRDLVREVIPDEAFDWDEPLSPWAELDSPRPKRPPAGGTLRTSWPWTTA